jgi:ketosteroid isomerase-like protein
MTHPDVQLLLDEAAIARVVHRYAAAVDRRDWERVRSCYHPDAREDRGTFRGGVDDFLAWLAAAVAPLVSMVHHITTVTADVRGDVADVESYCLAQHAGPDGRTALIHCRYVDRFARRGGEWRIAARRREILA